MSDQRIDVTNGDSPRHDLVEELKRTRRKCFQLREQIKAMHVAFDGGEISLLRRERDVYRQVLSDIVYRIDQGQDIEPAQLRLKVRVALDCWRMKGSQKSRTVRRLRREHGVV